MGPPDGNFHMPYETGVIAEWTGQNPHAQGRGGLREALLLAAGAAAAAADHAVLAGSAPAGRILRLHKRFDTRTSSYCEKGIELGLNVGVEAVCLTGQQPPLTLADELDATTTVPAGGSYEWHIGQSTRPFVAAAGQREAYELTCEQPGGIVLERLSLVIDRGQRAALNIGCGTGPTTFANGAAVGGSSSAPPPDTAPAVNGVAVPAGVAAPKRTTTSKATTRARRLRACNTRAGRIKSAKRRGAARRSCARRFGPRKRA
jgi:hypothetical protein